MKRISTEIRKAVRADHKSGAHVTDLAMKYRICEASVYKIIKELDRFDCHQTAQDVSCDDCMRRLRDKKKELEADVSSARARLLKAQEAYSQFIEQMRDIFEGGQDDGS